MPTSPLVVAGLLVLGSMLLLTGCSGDSDAVREIQAQQQARMQAESRQDHLGEAFDLLSRLVELNPERAEREISYHLNRWADSKSISDASAPEIIRTVNDVLPVELAEERISRKRFKPEDLSHIRDSYLASRILEWVDHERSDDPALADWLAKMETELGEEDYRKLRTATRLFDWTVRNIAFEPKTPTDPAPPGPSLPLGMKFRGPGYRQTDYKTMWYGIGDSLQRSGVFTLLCRQASIPAFMLAVPSPDTGELEPWCVGVKIGQEVYLFEFELGTYIPGPGQIGIATLQQARSDAVVLRRMNVPGFFDYWRSKGDIQQCTALLNLVPEAISPRMQLLESGLTGNRRMTLFVDVETLQEEIDEVAGIAGVRMWSIPLLAERYEEEMVAAQERDPLLLIWYITRYSMLNSEKSQLALGRWRHLHGQWVDDEEEDADGARTLYLAQRAPEFEIEDLTIDVDLQRAYNVRRDLGTSPEEYDMQIRQTQAMMRLGKRTATYWISLIQYDDQRYDTANNWFTKRVLTDNQLSFWEPSARYNLARSVEQMGDIERAIELYKTDGDPQEHGNRIRARLIGRDKTPLTPVENEGESESESEGSETESTTPENTETESSAPKNAETENTETAKTDSESDSGAGKGSVNNEAAETGTESGSKKDGSETGEATSNAGEPESADSKAGEAGGNGSNATETQGESTGGDSEN